MWSQTWDGREPKFHLASSFAFLVRAEVLVQECSWLPIAFPCVLPLGILTRLLNPLWLVKLHSHFTECSNNCPDLPLEVGLVVLSRTCCCGHVDTGFSNVPSWGLFFPSGACPRSLLWTHVLSLSCIHIPYALLLPRELLLILF